MNFRTKVPYFIIFGVHFSLSIWKLNGSLSIFVDFLYCSVAEHAFLSAIGVQILDGLIGEGNLLSAIWVMLLDLFAEIKTEKKTSRHFFIFPLKQMKRKLLSPLTCLETLVRFIADEFNFSALCKHPSTFFLSVGFPLLSRTTP